MGLVALLKAPKRYEDIAGEEICVKLGWFRKLRLFQILLKHPGEQERYQNAFWTYYHDNGPHVGLTRQSVTAMRRELRGLRRRIKAERREQRRLRSLLDDRERLFARVFDMKEVSE
jgi:hypothetical protein